jgi:hypothetical protein
MRILSSLLALLLVNVDLPATAWAQTWTTYKSEAGRYRIDMPGTPRLSAPLITLEDGSTVPNNQAAVDAGPIGYVVTYIDYPGNSLPDQAASRILRRARDGSANGHRLLRDKPITIAGNPGREYVIARTTNFTLVVRSTLVDNRLYQMIYAAPGQTEPTSPDVQRFLDSFALK